MKYVFLFLFSFNCFAGGYMSESQMVRTDKNSLSQHFGNKLDCDKKYNDCKDYPDSYNWNTFSKQNTQVDDFSKPNYSKSEIDICSGETDCREKLDLKNCTDTMENKYINQVYTEIYCSKFISYDQMTVLKIRLDTTKKAAWDAEKLAIKNKEDLRKTKISDTKKLTVKLKDGEDLTLDERRVLDLLLIEKLKE